MNIRKALLSHRLLIASVLGLVLLAGCGQGADDATDEDATTPTTKGETGNIWNEMAWDKGTWG